MVNARPDIEMSHHSQNPRYADSPSKVSMMPNVSWCAVNLNLFAWGGECGALGCAHAQQS